MIYLKCIPKSLISILAHTPLNPPDLLEDMGTWNTKQDLPTAWQHSFDPAYLLPTVPSPLISISQPITLAESSCSTRGHQDLKPKRLLRYPEPQNAPPLLEAMLVPGTPETPSVSRTPGPQKQCWYLNPQMIHRPPNPCRDSLLELRTCQSQ